MHIAQRRSLFSIVGSVFPKDETVLLKPADAHSRINAAQQQRFTVDHLAPPQHCPTPYDEPRTAPSAAPQLDTHELCRPLPHRLHRQSQRAAAHHRAREWTSKSVLQ
ncbi:unnamed protein product [Ceratitis capitata]|uniref:(Mediterranean fruit fly) hypothetical protein n=1 Tax=Ceratitis capitata TaxID=7213 RepID=A0A811UQK7_CERCA|nr:unnamed protein product [Ceratitis capitata]